MSIDWKKTGEKISSLYEEMEYHAEYNIERFSDDLKVALATDVTIPGRQNKPVSNFYDWILRFGDVLECRRPLLTKLFSFTNNSNGVDTLIEYCEYYKSYYKLNEIHNIPGCLSESPIDMLCFVFMMLAKNEKTEKVVHIVFDMLYMDTRSLLISDDPELNVQFGCLAMVIMTDSDLNAAVQAFVNSRHTYFEVSKVLVQEPIKEQLLSTMRKYGNEIEKSFDLYVFRNTVEALGNFSGKDKFQAISIWSEDIIAAKKFSTNVEVDTIWINAHGVLGAGLHSIIWESHPLFKFGIWDSQFKEDEESLQTSLKIIKTYDLFYGGKWHFPANGEYWTNKAGVSFAQASSKDISNSVNAARVAFKLWRSKKLTQRTEIIRSFAERLRANGESEYADMVLQYVDRSLESGTSLSIVRDGEAEILSTTKPIGVVAIVAQDQKMLLAKLIIASVTGNAVIVLLNSKSSVSFAPYCDLLGTCGFPPGVINCLFTTDRSSNIFDGYSIDKVLPEIHDSVLFNSVNLPVNQANEYIWNHNIFINVTKPKSVWLQLD